MAIVNKRRIVPRERGRNGRITNSSVYIGGSSSSSSSGSSGGGGDLTNYTQKTVDETITGNWLFGGQPTFNNTLFTSQGGGGANVELYNLAGELTVDGDRVLTVADTGSDNGLNADLLDGYHASDFPRKNEDVTIIGSWTITSGWTFTHPPTIDFTSGAFRVGDLSSFDNSSIGLEIDPIGGNVGFKSFEEDIFKLRVNENNIGVSRIVVGDIDSIANEILDIRGNQQLTGYIKGDGVFTSGFGGDNWQLTPDDNNQSHLTVDRLTVRDRMDIYELVINQIRATNGSLWVSDSVKCESISGSTITVNEDTNITFQANDIIKAQEFDGRDLRVYTARVVSVGTSSFTVADVVGTGWGGMSLVRIGNSVNTDRQGALYLTSSDNGAPYMSVIDGNNGITPSAHEKLRVGKLNGITSSVFGSLSGYGLWGEGTNNTGIYLSAEGELQIAGQITIKNPSDIDTSSLNNDTSWTDDTAANAAQSTANNATTDAANAQGTANTAIADAATAQSTANTAKSTTDKLETLATITNNEFKVSADASNYVRMFLNNASDWGIEGIIGGSDVFKLGDENKIAGFEFTNQYFQTENWTNGGVGDRLRISSNDGSIRINGTVNEETVIGSSGSYFRGDDSVTEEVTNIDPNGYKGDSTWDDAWNSNPLGETWEVDNFIYSTIIRAKNSSTNISNSYTETPILGNFVTEDGQTITPPPWQNEWVLAENNTNTPVALRLDSEAIGLISNGDIHLNGDIKQNGINKFLLNNNTSDAALCSKGLIVSRGIYVNESNTDTVGARIHGDIELKGDVSIDDNLTVDGSLLISGRTTRATSLSGTISSSTINSYDVFSISAPITLPTADILDGKTIWITNNSGADRTVSGLISVNALVRENRMRCFMFSGGDWYAHQVV